MRLALLLVQLLRSPLKRQPSQAGVLSIRFDTRQKRSFRLINKMGIKHVA